MPTEHKCPEQFADSRWLTLKVEQDGAVGRTANKHWITVPLERLRKPDGVNKAGAIKKNEKSGFKNIRENGIRHLTYKNARLGLEQWPNNDQIPLCPNGLPKIQNRIDYHRFQT